MNMRYTTVSVDVDVDDILCEADTEDLIDELKSRGDLPTMMDGMDGDTNRQILDAIYLKRRLGQEYQSELDVLIYNVLGKIV
jgi:hypothetical protein